MCLQELHWLPIKYRTMFKTLTIDYNAVHGIASRYLKEKLKQKHYHRTTRQSTSTGITLDIPLNRKKSFADRGHLPMLCTNTGMTSQTASELQRI